MIYIYTRVSTDGQTVDNQVLELLPHYPGAVLIEEVASGAKARPKLVAIIAELKRGDVVIAYSLDRLGRNTRDVLGMIESILDKGAKLILKREGAEYNNAMGRAMIQIMAAVAELERNLISERTKIALQLRKARGVKLGAPKHHPDAKRLKALSMLASGKSIRIVAKLLNVSKSTVQVWAAASNSKLVSSNK